jgi:hypothetical protein
MDQYLALFSIGRRSARGGGWGFGGPPDESLSASLLSSAPRVLGHARRWLGIPRRGTDPVDALKHEFNYNSQQLVEIMNNRHLTQHSYFYGSIHNVSSRLCDRVYAWMYI